MRPPRIRRRAGAIAAMLTLLLAVLAAGAWHHYEHTETDRIAALLDRMPLPPHAHLDQQQAHPAVDVPALVERYYTIPGPRSPTSLQNTQFLAYTRQLRRAGYRPVDRDGRADPSGFTLDDLDMRVGPDAFTLPAGRHARGGIEIEWLLPGTFVISAYADVLRAA